jgi:hypothetical protein
VVFESLARAREARRTYGAVLTSADAVIDAYHLASPRNTLRRQAAARSFADRYTARTVDGYQRWPP